MLRQRRTVRTFSLIVVRTPNVSPPSKAVADALVVILYRHLFPLKLTSRMMLRQRRRVRISALLILVVRTPNVSSPSKEVDDALVVILYRHVFPLKPPKG